MKICNGELCLGADEILNALPVHIYWKDLRGVYLGCNEKQACSLGLSSAHDIVGKTDYDFCWQGKEFLKNLCDHDAEVVSARRPFIFDEYTVDLHGDERVFISYKSPLKDETGEIVGVVGVSFDVTDRNAEQNGDSPDAVFLSLFYKEITGVSANVSKSIIEKVKDVRDYYEGILSLMPGHVYWKDIDGKYLGCNANQARSLGLKSRRDIVGKHAYEKLPIKQAKKLRANDKAIIESGKPYVTEEPGILHDGSEGVFLTQKIPLLDKDKNAIGLLGVSIDITEKKKLQAELEETRLQVKTQEERTKAMQVLGASLAHELRTPLATISNYADTKDFLRELLTAYTMATEAKLPVPFIRPMHIEALGESLVGIQKEATLASKIIDMLLTNLHDLAEAEKDYKKHSIVKCVNMAIERYPYVPDAQEKLVSFDVKNDFIVYGKDLLIMHILFNLMKNAFYYIEQAGKGKIKIHLELGEKVNKLIFTDTGSGIPEEQLPHVFDHFFSKRENGTGVGLTFSRMVMENLGGEMSCESKFGEYATFVMEFPVAG
ncbi:MAG: PAS domain-containing sensor histidine kinase [Gammaproteobacteria bacterium]|nr:PAS domain-containing sensor histidine kinase [Gammaproteobacteria bacterium]